MINKEEYYKLYKELYVTCIDNGEVFPNSLVSVIVPVEYRFTPDEKKSVDARLTDENKLKIHRKLLSRRQDELELMGYDDYIVRCDEYNEMELSGFVKKYPSFKSIMDIGDG